VTTWFVFSGVITLAICALALGDLIAVNSFNYFTGDYGYWFYPDSSFLWVVGTIGVAGVFSHVSHIGMQAYTSVTNKGYDGFPQTWLLFFAVYGLLIVWLYPSVVEWLESDIDTGDVFLDLFRLLLVPIVGLVVFIPLFILNLIYSYVGAPLILFGVISLLPFFFIGIYSFFTGSSDASRVAERHVKNKRPNNEIEKELADAMVSGLKSDIELQAIIKEMSPVSRFLNSLTYKKKAEKYREMRNLMEEQISASREREKMGLSAHELERERRK